MDNTDDQPGITQRLEDLRNELLNRIDLMEARLIAEFQKMTLPAPVKSTVPIDARITALLESLKARQAEREEEKPKWDAYWTKAEARQAELKKTLDGLEGLSRLAQERLDRRNRPADPGVSNGETGPI